jgi:hypothetical protein
MTIGPTFLVVLKTLVWVNWLLLLVNLLPAFPLDGAYLLRAIIQLRWPIGQKRASIVVSRLAQICALILLSLALLWNFDQTQMLLPIRLTLAVLAIFLFFSSRLTRTVEPSREPDQTVPDLEFSTSLAALEDELEQAEMDESAPLGRWLAQRHETRRRRQEEIEQDEDRQVDEILARVYEFGIESLDDEQREFLEHVSRRYRSRLGK